VGANSGNWSDLALSELSPREIYCFEIAESSFRLLSHKLDGRAKCFNLGLSNQRGKIDYKDYGPGSTLNTLSQRSTFWDDQHSFQLRPVEVLTGDSFCEANGVSRIDLLKIDVEGAENQVLQGFSNMLGEQRVRLIQFEYGYANGDQHFLTKDFYEFFSDLGYRVGLIRKRGVVFKKFSYDLNDFDSGPNYVAIPESDHILKAEISA
jgi:FkbM family methyltransferase